MIPAPLLDAAAVERIIREGLPMFGHAGLRVVSVAPGVATVRLAWQPWMLRPGGTLSGPVLMMAADTAMYAVILAHIGAQVMAVTADLNIRFLRKPPPADVIAEGRVLRLGRRQAVVEVLIRCDGNDELVAQATGSYALPG